MENSIECKNSILVDDGEVTDLSIRFTGDLHRWIKEYFKDPKTSQIHKFIYGTLQKALNPSKCMEDL